MNVGDQKLESNYENFKNIKNWPEIMLWLPIMFFGHFVLMLLYTQVRN